MSATHPAFEVITPDNKGPAVVVVGYACVITSILLTAIRVISAAVLRRGIAWDDVSIVLGTMFALAQTILAERAVDSGLGKHMDKLNAGDINSYYKFNYASQILAIAAMALAKVSVLVLMLRLWPFGPTLRRACFVTGAAIALWMVFSVLALALQCGIPRPWVYTAERCAGRGAVWYPVVLLNIVTDLVVATLFLPLIRKLQMPPSKQMLVGLLFASRLLCAPLFFSLFNPAKRAWPLIIFRVCAGGIAQLALLPHALHASDQTWSIVNLAILIQVVMNLSIITADIPSVSSFLSKLQTGRGTRIPEPRYEINHSNLPPQNYKLSDQSSKNQFRPEDGSKVSNRIYADPRISENKEKSKTPSKRRNDHREGANGHPTEANEGVMQSWEISYEVEERHEDVSLRSDRSTADLKP